MSESVVLSCGEAALSVGAVRAGFRRARGLSDGSESPDSLVRRRYEMEQEAAMRDSIGRLMIQQSKDIRKRMK